MLPPAVRLGLRALDFLENFAEPQGRMPDSAYHVQFIRNPRKQNENAGNRNSSCRVAAPSQCAEGSWASKPTEEFTSDANAQNCGYHRCVFWSCADCASPDPTTAAPASATNVRADLGSGGHPESGVRYGSAGSAVAPGNPDSAGWDATRHRRWWCTGCAGTEAADGAAGDSSGVHVGLSA